MKQLIWIAALVIIVALVILGFYVGKNTRKLGYVNVSKVFEVFELKKKLEADLNKVQLAKQSYLDSIKLKVQTLSLSASLNKDVEELKKVYLLKENQFIKEQEASFQEYNEQIWKQLNQYIEDFGKDNKYDYLFGTTGQGNLMYANQQDDVTDLVIKYVNTKYYGKTK